VKNMFILRKYNTCSVISTRKSSDDETTTTHTHDVWCKSQLLVANLLIHLQSSEDLITPELDGDLLYVRKG